MSHDLKLGQIIEGAANRDATHIAVAPVFSKEVLSPGMHVGLVAGSSTEVSALIGGHIGIVDPFLLKNVQPGQKFYLFLYPQTVTGLRHEWTHPAFVDKTAAALALTRQEESRRWIEAFAARLDQTYNRVIEAATMYLDYKEYTYDNSETYKRDAAKYYENLPEFWRHFSVVTGKAVPEAKTKDGFFTCSC